jgi:hypothetical protein
MARKSKLKLSNSSYVGDVEWVGDFSCGRAWFRVHTFDGVKYGIVDRKLNIICKPKYHEIKNYSNGVAIAKLTSQRFCVIDKNGNQIGDTVYSDMVSPGFVGGLCAARAVGGTAYGFIDKRGVWKIKPVFQLAYSFSEGRAYVAIDNGFYFINKRGDIVSDKLAPYMGL